MNKKSSTGRSRRERAAQIQEAQRRSERRRSLLIIGPAVLVAVLIVGSASFVLFQQQREQDDIEAAAKRPILGVKSFDDLSQNHVDGSVDYPQDPPVGGDHNPRWTNCAAYDREIDETQAVHSLEHGAVWLTYSPALKEEALNRLNRFVTAEGFVLVSPRSDQSNPIVATAWGKQLTAKTADDAKLAAFVQKYQQGPQAPEPGAPCSGGVDG